MKKHKQKHIQSPKKENNNAPPDYRPSANRDNQTRSDVCFPLEEIISKQHTPRSTGYPVKLSPKKQKKKQSGAAWLTRSVVGCTRTPRL